MDKELERLKAISKKYAVEPTEPVAKFITQVDRLQERYKGHTYANHWLMDKDLLIAARTALSGTQTEMFRK